jgi:hypothetical protein
LNGFRDKVTGEYASLHFIPDVAAILDPRPGNLLFPATAAADRSAMAVARFQ